MTTLDEVKTAASRAIYTQVEKMTTEDKRKLLIESITRRAYDVLSVLIDCEIDLDFGNSHRELLEENETVNPLLLACHLGNSKAVKMLVEAGCDINVETQWATNALMYSLEQKDMESVDLLLSNNIKLYVTIKKTGHPVNHNNSVGKKLSTLGYCTNTDIMLSTISKYVNHSYTNTRVAHAAIVNELFSFYMENKDRVKKLDEMEAAMSQAMNMAETQVAAVNIGEQVIEPNQTQIKKEELQKQLAYNLQKMETLTDRLKKLDETKTEQKIETLCDRVQKIADDVKHVNKIQVTDDKIETKTEQKVEPLIEQKVEVEQKVEQKVEQPVIVNLSQNKKDELQKQLESVLAQMEKIINKQTTKQFENAKENK